jgi:hypothetical protein
MLQKGMVAALSPRPHVHLVRTAGGVVPHRKLREAIIPPPRQ